MVVVMMGWMRRGMRVVVEVRATGVMVVVMMVRVGPWWWTEGEAGVGWDARRVSVVMAVVMLLPVALPS